MGSLDGKVIIITGASRGIGAAAASALARAGATVVLTARDGALTEQVAASIGPAASAHACDVSDYGAVAALVAATKSRFGRLDTLVNNAGVIEPIAVTAQSDPAAWAQQRDERGDQLAVAHPVQRLADGDRPGAAVAEQRCQRGEVAVGPEDPARVRDTLFGGGPSGAGQHVRLGINPGHRLHPAGDRQRELPGPAAKVEDDVLAGQAESVGERVDHSRGVAAPVLVIKLRNLAAESEIFVHRPSVGRRRPTAEGVQPTA